MAVSGLIINFSTESGPPPVTLEALLGHPFIQVGERSGHRLPIVVETSDAEQTDSMWEWLNSLPGVTLIDLAFLHFDEDEDADQCAGGLSPSLKPGKDGCASTEGS